MIRNKRVNIHLARLCVVLSLIGFTLALCQTTYAQAAKPRELRRITATPGEIISISSTLPMNKAIELLNELSRKYTDKVIIDPTDTKKPIGVDIVGLHWLDALETILRANDLGLVEGKDHYLITRPDQGAGPDQVPVERVLFDTREVSISVLFFEMNTSKLQQLGTSWNFLANDGDAVRSSAAEEKSGLFQVDISEKFDFGSLSATLKALASNQAGELLASPQITVRSGKEGRIQIGSDYSITTKDFSGNTITQFFSTGSIIAVTPQIVTVDSSTFIHLDLEVQKSNASNSELGIEVKKTSAQTSILLLNGEETLIGGLYYNEKINNREGIPILKDLPWWVFGIKYLTGYETSNTIRKELIVILKAELLPSLKERFAYRRATKGKEPRVLEQGLQNFDKRLNGYIEQIGQDKQP